MDTQFLQDHIGPQNIQTTSKTRAPHFLPRAFPQCHFLETLVQANKPASQAGQAIKAYFRDIMELPAVKGQDRLHPPCRNVHWTGKGRPLGSAGSVVCRFQETSHITNKNHMLFMDRFYNFVVLFHLLKNEIEAMLSRKNYPKEFGKRLTEHG